MKTKGISEAERREREELAVLEKRAKQQEKEQKAEEQAREYAKNVYSNIWSQFSEDLKKGKAYASRELLGNLTDLAEFLVPVIMTAKEHTTLIMELTDNLSGDDQTRGETPMEIQAKWLRGEIELSRIPLEEKIH